MTRQHSELHIYPSDDSVQDHEPSMACWCGPYRDADNPRLVVHWVDGIIDAVDAVSPATETIQ